MLLTADLQLVPSDNPAQLHLEYHLTKNQRAWDAKDATLGLFGLVLLVLFFRRRTVHGLFDER
jgi:hypothetical protein